ncbi:MAG: helix-turn-helix domain-containing protein [Roseburia sp.]|nr:helix-turn-helix domain-containing protein [Roseburia sp.]MCM1097501.1 helix-turn-helix domain-containing protein [Ruminococcus flavefaciens]
MLRHYRSKTFYNFLFSYIAVMVLGVGIILFFVLSYLFPMINREVNATHQAALEQTADAIDSRLRDIYHTSYQLSYYSNNLVTYYAMEDSPAKDVKIINELKSYANISTFISDIGLLSSSGSFIYTSSDVYPQELFFSNEYIYPTMKNPANLFLSYSANTVLPASLMDSSCQYVTFIQPPYALSNLPDVTLLFWVEEAQLTALTRPVVEDGISFFTIFSETGDPIYCSLKGLSQEDTLRLRGQALDDEANRFSAEHGSYTLFARASRLNDWIYVYAINDKAASRSMTVVWLLLLTMLLLTALFSVPVIAYFMRVNYLPLKQMKNLTDKLLNSEDNSGDEVGSLQNALQYLSGLSSSKLSLLQDDDLLHSLRNTLLFSLLKGHISSQEEFNASGSVLGMSFTAPNHQTLLIQLSNSDASDFSGAKLLHALLSQVFTDGYQFYSREFFHKNQHAVVLAFEDERADNTVSACKELADLALEQGYTLTIGIGQAYREFTGFQTSCLEAEMALQDSFVAGQGAILAYHPSNWQLFTEYTSLPVHLLSSLQASLLRKDFESFSRQANQLFTAIEEQRVSADLARSFCHTLTSLMIHSLSSQDISRIGGSLSLAYQADTLNGYRLHIANVLQKLTLAEEESPQNTDDDLLAQIRQYIAQNYDDCNFSLQKCADALHINNSYLSHYFKEQTDMNLNQYIATLRIQRAKELLADTSLSLSVISEEVGYYNLNSFIRRFKQITGTTPGNYRKEVSGEAADAETTPT